LEIPTFAGFAFNDMEPMEQFPEPGMETTVPDALCLSGLHEISLQGME